MVLYFFCSLYVGKQAAKFRMFSKHLAKAACALEACMVFNLGNNPSTRKNARQIHSLLYRKKGAEICSSFPLLLIVLVDASRVFRRCHTRDLFKGGIEVRGTAES